MNAKNTGGNNGPLLLFFAKNPQFSYLHPMKSPIGIQDFAEIRTGGCPP